MNYIDLRSDTVTHPTAEMRKAMYEAEVGDDVYGEDPTVIRLENLAAQMAGKEAGLFVTSGTMGNQVAIMTHTKRGDEVICEAEAHIYLLEVGGIACLSGAQARTIQGNKGIITAEDIKNAIREKDVHAPDTGLISVENTHNRAGGTYYPQSILADIYSLARKKSIPVHMDGARIFNAAISQNIKLKEIAQYTDTLQLCLSKGLCAPVGSLILGSREFISKAKRYRKMLGGGMRQAGILAAAGVVALENMVDRLVEDHHNAKDLAEGLANLGFKIDLATVQSNIVIVDVTKFNLDAKKLVGLMNEKGVKANATNSQKIRFVTHYGISKGDIASTLKIISDITKVIK